MPTATVTLNFTIDLDDDQLESILDSSSLGINYWTEEADIVSEEDELPYLRIKAAGEEDIDYVSKENLETAIVKVLERSATPGFSGDARNDLIDCLHNDCIDAIDPDTANQLVQIACYGEVIYG